MEKKSPERIFGECIALGILGYAVGEYFNRRYRECDSERKTQWRQTYPMHHGEVGVILSKAGKASKSPQLQSLGVGLMASDINDYNEWKIRP